MCRSRVIRSLSLLLFFSLLLTGFGSVNVSAATNLINPDLIQWEIPDSSISIDILQSGNLYICRPGLIGEVNGSNFYFGFRVDKTSLVAGNSYTFSFHLPNAAEINAQTTYNNTEAWFRSQYNGGVVNIGFGTMNSDGTYTPVVEFISITYDNYLQYAGNDFVKSFTCPDYEGNNPYIYIMITDSDAGGVYFFDNSFSLVDNAEEDEEGLLSKLFEWFEKKFNAIGDSFSNLGNKLSTGFSNLGDRIKTFFSDLGDSISSGLTAVKEGIQDKLDQVKTTLVELGESLINGIKGLFVPDEDYILEWKDNLDKLLQDHLGMIYTSANLVTDLVQKIFDIVFNAPDTYGLTVPEVSFEILNGTQINLIPETEISFDFMENKTFKFIYGLYTVGLYIAFGVLEVKYGIRVYKKVMAN